MMVGWSKPATRRAHGALSRASSAQDSVAPGLTGACTAPLESQRATARAARRPLSAGDAVEAKYGGIRSVDGAWFRGTVAAVSHDGGRLTYAIDYHDGDTERIVLICDCWHPQLDVDADIVPMLTQYHNRILSETPVAYVALLYDFNVLGSNWFWIIEDI